MWSRDRAGRSEQGGSDDRQYQQDEAEGAVTVAVVTITATADSALVRNRSSLAAGLRYALILAALLSLAGAGFATARSLAGPASAPAPVSSESFGPLPTVSDSLSGRGKEPR
jgi:hypothetical protein